MAILATVFSAADSSIGRSESSSPDPPTKVEFARDIRPLLARHCHECHGSTKSEGGLRLDLRQRAFKGGDSGVAVKPKDHAASLLLERIANDDADLRMPLGKPALAQADIELLRRWIEQGADWPAEADANLAASVHWSLRPLVRPPVPSAADADWPRSPEDRFILAMLSGKALAPTVEADRRTLIRRLTFGLTGLPPTPDEVREFLADFAPDAYDRLADRLLASPRYGERWSRHWMDVVHFAETHGHDQDRPRPNAWPYRDYLIRAMNSDRPYARFVADQVAGDVLFADDPQSLVATGMLAAGPWDESSLRCIVDDTRDKEMAQLLDRDDMLSTVMSTFTSTTIHCARCHSHKFDPIPQADYYALQAVFAGVDRANRPYDPDPQRHRQRQALVAEKRRIQQRDQAELLRPDVQSLVEAWERRPLNRPIDWTVSTPTKVESANGSTATTQADGSALFTGERPERDTYTFVARTSLRNITAVRLEVLTDGSLPASGPGRADNGNFHLSEIRITASSAAVPIASAVADFDQEGWTINMAIDGNPQSAWGVHPAFGKPHFAVFILRQPLTSDGDIDLTITLEQLHGNRHLIGRPRLSVTNHPAPLSASPAPTEIAAILATPSNQRTPPQRAALARHVLTQKVDEQLAALPAPQMVYAVASDFVAENNFKPAGKPRPVFVLRRGDIRQPLASAVPGALECVNELPARFELPSADDEGSRRVALAHWLVDQRNVLTWRSIVNRVWHYHFGRGLVDTPNDLGRMGSPPTHPELLDWLAVEFRDGGGSLKILTRRLVTSATFRQASKHQAAAAKIDAGNRYLWRMNRQRLDAESVRDAVLSVSGKLDLTMGGPSVKQFVESPGIHVTPKVDYDTFDIDQPGNYRRSVYRFLFRTLPDPFMETMDCPDASQLAPTRTTSVTALQALAMLNNRFVVRQSEHFAARLRKPSVADRVAAAIELVYSRPATAEERSMLAAYAERHGMANVCRLLLNSNEFLFIP